ncbi:hypothetical protein E2C01_005180 [Portunus trituberculatus]|uniref:Uncharacterized protein n=1 Tax=Portunus trituberculatus TaxID=210409 RepID=A0A5B7CSM5_PORTR|nr:hypothetical protein [Portunus trituberculatus]
MIITLNAAEPVLRGRPCGVISHPGGARESGRGLLRVASWCGGRPFIFAGECRGSNREITLNEAVRWRGYTMPKQEGELGVTLIPGRGKQAEGVHRTTAPSPANGMLGGGVAWVGRVGRPHTVDVVRSTEPRYQLRNYSG